MRDHITPAMHRQFMPMFGTNIASATNRNTTPEHPNPQSLIPSNLLDSLPQRSPPSPHHTYSLSPSVRKETHAKLSNRDPQTPPCLATPRPPSLAPSRLLTSWHQQWLYCTPEQANIWKPRKNELENLNKHVRFAPPHDGEEDIDSEQKQWPQRPFGSPNTSSPTKPMPQSDDANGHSATALQHLDDELLETQTQRHTEDTHRARAHQASESVQGKSAKKEMRFDEEEEEGAGAVLGDGDEEKGEVLYECGGMAKGADKEERLNVG